MELRQLRYFVRIVELGSVSRAAKDLFIAQPALSSQLSNLEEELGVRLLSRSVRGVKPTAAGDLLYLHAQAVLRQIDRLRHEVSGQSATAGGPVSIGLPTSAANVLAGPLIGAVQARYPDVKLQIVESLSGHLEELVATGRLEMSLLFVDVTDTALKGRDKNRLGHLQWTPLLDEELFLLSRPDETSGEHSSISLEQASHLRFVLPGKGNMTRQLIDQAFESAGLKLDVLAELDSLSTIQSVIESGLGATILSRSALLGHQESDRLIARSISGVTLKRRISLCTSDIMALGAAAECVIALLPPLVHQLIDEGQWAGATAISK